MVGNVFMKSSVIIINNRIDILLLFYNQYLVIIIIFIKKYLNGMIKLKFLKLHRYLHGFPQKLL